LHYFDFFFPQEIRFPWVMSLFNRTRSSRTSRPSLHSSGRTKCCCFANYSREYIHHEHHEHHEHHHGHQQQYPSSDEMTSLVDDFQPLHYDSFVNRIAPQYYQNSRFDHPDSSTFSTTTAGQNKARDTRSGSFSIPSTSTVPPSLSSTPPGCYIRQPVSTCRLFFLTVVLLGMQFVWSVELAYGTPFLLSLGLEKSMVSLVWLVGPLSGLIIQPLIGALSDQCTLRMGRRRPFLLASSVLVILSLFVILHQGHGS